MANYYLPQEILVEIFSYLPAKSIGKCRCLSKTWNTNLSNSQFIDLHLTRKTQENLIIISHSGFLNHVTTKNSIDKSYYPFPMKLSIDIIIQLGDGWTTTFCSCNGLVLLGKDDDTFVVNPVTRQQVQIPQPPSMITGFERETIYGFGYDRSCHDFKIVAISIEEEYDYSEKDIVDVYSMKTRVWKNVGYSPYGSNIDRFMAFMNGAIHWLTGPYFNDYHIAAFDLATQSFHQLSLPKEIQKQIATKHYISHGRRRLAVFQGCLSIVDGDVWVMKEYGVVDSWVKLHIDKRVKPVAFLGDEEIVCSTDRGRWMLNDLKKEIAKEMICIQTNSYWKDLIGFEESIVSPEQGTISS